MNNLHKLRLFSFIIIVTLLLSATGVPHFVARAATVITFSGSELLGRPTSTSITINVVPSQSINIFYEYGVSSGNYPWHTDTGLASGGQPYETIINGLAPNTKYYYRMQYQVPGDSDWVVRAEHSFWTQHAQGNSFTFTITSDSHVSIMLGSSEEWTKTMANVAADHPDFEIDLGDTFAMDNVTSVSGAESAYLTQRQYFDLVGGSAAIYLATGNHEEQEGWHLDDTGDPATSKPVMGTNAQNKYYLNPVPDSFYSGDTNPYSYLDGDHLREDYYAWTWGDALFVVIDPFWYTMTKPFIGNTGGGETSDTGSGDRWDWTLGLEQFNWLKQTLEDSTAEYKFIFAHHMVGGSDDYVRGGANPANIAEWGGYDENGTTWGWDTNRDVSQWGTEPVHQILVDNHVSAFFHGHDHQYAYEKRDGIVYQSVPAAGFTGNGFNIYTTGQGYTIQALPSDGHLRVTVSPDQATVDYIASTGGSVNYSYEIIPQNDGETYELTTEISPAGSGTTFPAAGTHIYPENSIVAVSATPANGYVFDHWSGACIGSGSCSVTMDGNKTVTANFSVLNVAPVAVSDTYSATQDTARVVSAPGVLANDTDANDDPLTAIKVSNPSHGTVVLNANGSFTYTPNSAYSGDDSFSYKANDGLLDSNTVSVIIHVNAITPPPVMPSSFYGEIHFSSNPPLVGDDVEAFIAGIVDPVEVEEVSGTNPLAYGIDVPGDDAATPEKDGGEEGDEVVFKINGQVVAKAVWHSGSSVRLDFHPPEVVPDGPHTGNEGAAINFAGGANDWGLDTNNFQWDWDNDGAYDTTGFTPSHTWSDDGVYTVKEKATDAQGGEGEATFTVTVNNVPPTNISAGGPYEGAVGEAVALSGTATCAAVDICTYAWDLDNDGLYDDASGATTSHTWIALGDYTVGLRVTDDDGSGGTATAQVRITGGASQEIELVVGWNLVSFNLHPGNTAIGEVLSSIEGNYDLVYAWNAGAGSWMKYAPGVGYINTLTELDESMGFWIRMTAADTLEVVGSNPETSGIELAAGWNLVGYPSSENGALPEIFSEHGVGTDFSLVYGYDAADTVDHWKKYDSQMPYGFDLEELISGMGYWIQVGGDHTWNVIY